MTTPLQEQLRDAADACTPSPLQDLLRRAADAVDGEQKPAAWVSDNVIPLRGLKDNHPAILTATKCLENPIPLYTHPAPIPDGMVLVPVEPTDAMINAGIELAMHVKLSSSYTWPDYIRDMYKAMLKAAGESS